MKLPLVFRPIAQEEFSHAAEWYEKQRQGLGERFVAEVEKVLNSIAQQPLRYPVIEEDVHEALVSRFPFCVYYRIKIDRILILAVFHTSRDPAVWQRRM